MIERTINVWKSLQFATAISVFRPQVYSNYDIFLLIELFCI